MHATCADLARALEAAHVARGGARALERERERDRRQAPLAALEIVLTDFKPSREGQSDYSARERGRAAGGRGARARTGDRPSVARPRAHPLDETTRTCAGSPHSGPLSAHRWYTYTHSRQLTLVRAALDWRCSYIRISDMERDLCLCGCPESLDCLPLCVRWFPLRMLINDVNAVTSIALGDSGRQEVGEASAHTLIALS